MFWYIQCQLCPAEQIKPATMDYGHPEQSNSENKLSLSIAMPYSKHNTSALPCGTPFLSRECVHIICHHDATLY